MLRRMLAPSLAASIVLAPAAFAQPAGPDPDLARGVRQVEDGDYDSAIVTLDATARRLAADPGRARDLSQAYLYLGIAYIGKGHEAAAKAKFREAVAQIKDLTLSPDKFPPKVIDLFEAARAEARSQDSGAAPSPRPGAEPGATKKKGSGGGGSGGKAVLIVAGLAAAGGGVALAAGGGGGGSNGTADTPRLPPPTPSPSSRRSTWSS